MSETQGSMLLQLEEGVGKGGNIRMKRGDTYKSGSVGFCYIYMILEGSPPTFAGLASSKTDLG